MALGFTVQNANANIAGNEGKATNKFDTRNSIIEIEWVK